MAPHSTNGSSMPENDPPVYEESTFNRQSEPLKLSDALEQFEYFEVVPCIGREYKNVDLSEWLKAPNSDDLLRDLAITSRP